MVIGQGQQYPRFCSEYSSCQDCTREECIWCHCYEDPINKGFCYYDLTIDYQFTFNLSKKENPTRRSTSGIRYPLWIQISFSQPPKLNLYHIGPHSSNSKCWKQSKT
ncbi:PREDICTED: uncharacterized protein LOC108560338 [Nicrophorus vespilloides]|uniref:Uncharacterized protein LOC108560338 n=1 Tax=Nicrophorus vespilloides TaxID=110193 RepID=A0ABM1MFH9_NICVS|nr:PREDICTED: uncharacterized protein LOC108560338 [Nicrophorus vespilloides]